MLGGAVGAAGRSPTSAGGRWRSRWPHRKVVSPSCTSRWHLRRQPAYGGLLGSKNIVAINKDPDANIFKAARFGIVDDFSKVLPPLIEAVKKEKAAGLGRFDRESLGGGLRSASLLVRGIVWLWR